jgi:hypothetical protein
LREAEANEPAWRINSYIDNGNGHADSPVDAAHAELEAAKLADRRVTRLEADLDAELGLPPTAATAPNRRSTQHSPFSSPARRRFTISSTSWPPPGRASEASEKPSR